ncbi:AAA family ATPase [Paenibacillus sp. CMAA1364]
MLVRFNVQNYLSFMTGVSLDLESAPLTEHEDTHTFEVDQLKLLKSAVIYGANASGKSNILKAMGVMKELVLNSSKESNATEDIDVTPFRLSTLTEKLPTIFEIEIIQSGQWYRYGFSVDTTHIHDEWLYRKRLDGKGKEIKLFSRDKGKIDIPKKNDFYDEGSGLEDKTRHNALFLSVVANFNGLISQEIQQWFEEFTFMSGVANSTMRHTSKMLEKESNKNKIIKLLQAADVGIEDLIVEKIEANINLRKDLLLKEILSKNFGSKWSSEVLFSSRRKYDENENEVGYEMFKVDESESEGTKKLLALAGPIIEKLENGGVMVIDELDAKMHPLMTKQIVELFNSYDTNKSNAQLIYATHDVTNLSNKLFRRDQLWFVEKDDKGSSELFSLADFRDDDSKKIRKDATYAKDYLLGKYGAIPKFRSWQRALEGNDENP